MESTEWANELSIHSIAQHKLWLWDLDGVRDFATPSSSMLGTYRCVIWRTPGCQSKGKVSSPACAQLNLASVRCGFYSESVTQDSIHLVNQLPHARFTCRNQPLGQWYPFISVHRVGWDVGKKQQRVGWRRKLVPWLWHLRGFCLLPMLRIRMYPHFA